MTKAAAILGVALAPATAAAGSLEIAIHAGSTSPFYEQSFRYDPGRIVSPIAGVSIEQQGTFALDAKGALAAGASVSWFVAGPVALEARIDTADVNVNASGGRYEARADLPAPLPDLSSQLDLTAGRVDLERLRPISIDLKLRSPGRIRVAVSAGVSYLPRLTFVASQAVGLGVTGVDGRGARLDVATLALRAQALPDDDGGRFGGNVGVGIQVPVSSRVSLFADGRGFLFGKHTLRWGRADNRPLSRIEEALLTEVEARLEPVDFNPTFFQLAAGLSLKL